MKHILQMLALPVIGQVRLIADDYRRVALLSAEFNACHQALCADVGHRLTPQQANALTRLDNRLLQLCRQSPAPLCSEVSLRKSPEWREVRMTARAALVRFGWRLEVPARWLPGTQRLPIS